MQLDWKSNWHAPEAARFPHSIFRPGNESSPETQIFKLWRSKVLLGAGFRASHAVCWSQIEDPIIMILINRKQQGRNSTCCSMMSLLITMISLNMLACSSNVAWSTTIKPLIDNWAFLKSHYSEGNLLLQRCLNYKCQTFETTEWYCSRMIYMKFWEFVCK